MNLNEQPGAYNGPAEVRLVRILPGPIERIWEYLTDPEKRARWFAGGPRDLLMGDEVPPRRQFIEDNALNVQYLDV